MFLRLCLVLFIALSFSSVATAAGSDCTPTVTGFLELEQTRPMESRLGTAYIAAAAAGDTACLSVIDLGPTPSVMGTWNSPNCSVTEMALYVGGLDTTRVAMIGNFLEGTNCGQPGYKNMIIEVDVSDPWAPTPIDTTFVFGGCLTDVAYDGEGNLYTGSSPSPATSPARLTAVRDEGNLSILLNSSYSSIRDILIDGPMAYVITSASQDSLHVIEIDSLTVVGAVSGFGTSPAQLDLREDGILFVSDGVYGLAAVDVTDPANPVVLDFGGSQYGRSLVVDGDRAYVGTSIFNNALDVFDISDPSNLICIGDLTSIYGDPASGGDFALLGTTVYLQSNPDGILGGPPGLYVVDVSDCAPTTGVEDTPSTTATLRVAPNVLRSGPARITLRTDSVHRPEPLRVVDITGRLVDQVPLEFAGEGVWTGQWDPEEEGGVSGGKYWVVGESAAEAVTVIP